MRIELGGEGVGIPIEALPDPSVSGDLPPQTLLLPAGNFDKTDYVGLGYTHFEVWCIGAAGGAGGSYLETSEFYTNGAQHYGGAGGGGGLHHVAGLLSDLATLTPVVVGVAGLAGVDNVGVPKYLMATSFGLPGETDPTHNLSIVDTGARPLTRGGNTYIRADGSYVSPWTKIDVLANPISSTYQQSAWNGPGGTGPIPAYPYVVKLNPAFVATTDGNDGGYSSFGTICKASGGKAGKRAPMFARADSPQILDERWSAYHRDPQDGGYYSHAWDAPGHPGGDGGDGGAGNSTVAGGGGVGGSSILNFKDLGVSGAGDYQGSTSILPTDGTWDGTIGKGGGGGRGGGFYPTQHYSDGSISAPSITATPQNGGQGSFNYGDTSKYGPRQNASGVIPGGGGGAKFNSLQLYGGRAIGSNPDGAVLIRIVKLT